jgi:hypothetical protein
VAGAWGKKMSTEDATKTNFQQNCEDHLGACLSCASCKNWDLLTGSVRFLRGRREQRVGQENVDRGRYEDQL